MHFIQFWFIFVSEMKHYKTFDYNSYFFWKCRKVFIKKTSKEHKQSIFRGPSMIIFENSKTDRRFIYNSIGECF